MFSNRTFVQNMATRKEDSKKKKREVHNVKAWQSSHPHHLEDDEEEIVENQPNQAEVDAQAQNDLVPYMQSDIEPQETKALEQYKNETLIENGMWYKEITCVLQLRFRKKNPIGRQQVVNQQCFQLIRTQGDYRGKKAQKRS